MLFRKKKENKHGLMALVGETAKMAKNMIVLDKTEAALEKELERERTYKPKSKFGKVRKKGEHILHSKQVLLMVVILNVIDCMLVLGELMLDIKYVTDLLSKEYDRSDKFISDMKHLYPARLSYIMYDDIGTLEDEILNATLTWDGHVQSHDPSTHTSGNTSSLIAGNHGREKRTAVSRFGLPHGNSSGGHDHVHSIEEDIAHGLHKASITILGILVVETILKIFFVGRQLLEHKLECFDGFIVFVSFVVDLVFLKGLQQFKVQEFVLILAFLVPWRVIRVVNSLVVAIMDHEHFRLKLLYKQKKKVSHDLKEVKTDIAGLNACIKELERLCADHGISETLVQLKLNMYRKVKSKSNPLGALSGFAIGGDAMKNPFQNGGLSHNAVVVTVETGTEKQRGSDKDKDDSVVVQDDDKNDNFANTPLVNRKRDSFLKTLHTLNVGDSRPRSRSAIEPRQINEEEPKLVNFLAEQSAGFIATMSNDSGSTRSLNLETNSTKELNTEENQAEETGKVDGQDIPDTAGDEHPHAYINEATQL